MSAGQMGQMATIALACVLVGVWLYHLGFFRGWRRAKETDAATVNHLARVGLPETATLSVVRGSIQGSYRSRKTPIAFPVDPDHQNHVDHG